MSGRASIERFARRMGVVILTAVIVAMLLLFSTHFALYSSAILVSSH